MIPEYYHYQYIEYWRKKQLLKGIVPTAHYGF